MKIGDKVQIVDNPISLLKQHAGIKGNYSKPNLKIYPKFFGLKVA